MSLSSYGYFIYQKTILFKVLILLFEFYCRSLRSFCPMAYPNTASAINYRCRWSDHVLLIYYSLETITIKENLFRNEVSAYFFSFGIFPFYCYLLLVGINLKHSID